MSILSILEMPSLKKTAAKYGYTVHMHDACGGQLFTLEAVGDTQSDDVHDAISNFFADRSMTVNFYDAEKMNFTAK